jgi:threonine dehydratase
MTIIAGEPAPEQTAAAIERDAIADAAARIAGRVRSTPVLELGSGAWALEGSLALKLELMQRTGSFKVRGAFNCLLSQVVPPAGVVAASGGNHGVAVAYAAQQLGHRAEIFVPEFCPPVKVERLRSLGARVTIGGAFYADALTASVSRAAETGALMVHAYDHAEVVAGQGTLAREFLQQVPDLDTILVAVGGGGLLAGVASWCSGSVRVVGVEAERCPTLMKALSAGRPVDVEVGGVAADALGARRIGNIAFAIASRHGFVHSVVGVSDEAIREAQHALWGDVRVVTEPGGATALAALLSGVYRPARDERVGVVLCGGNASLLQVAEAS